MGYRSDVSIELEDKAFEAMDEAFRELRRRLGGDDAICLPDVRSSNFGTKILEWTSVKWHSGYGFPEIDTVEDVLRRLSDEHGEEDGWSYCFIRLGEDDSDTEEKTNNTGFLPNIYVHREICAEYSADEDGGYPYRTLGD